MSTTLEILAPYLPYGIEVEMLWFPLDEDRHILRGLDREGKGSVLLDDLAEGKACAPSACLPVLRPFADLVKPLSDGTVPAIEIAKLARACNESSSYAANDRFSFGSEDEDESEDELFISNPGLWGKGNGVVIYSNWEVDESTHRLQPAQNQLAIINYLRSHHFAVGLEPHQFIAKTA